MRIRIQNEMWKSFAASLNFIILSFLLYKILKFQWMKKFSLVSGLISSIFNSICKIQFLFVFQILFPFFHTLLTLLFCCVLLFVDINRVDKWIWEVIQWISNEIEKNKIFLVSDTNSRNVLTQLRLIQFALFGVTEKNMKCFECKSKNIHFCRKKNPSSLRLKQQRRDENSKNAENFLTAHHL